MSVASAAGDATCNENTSMTTITSASPNPATVTPGATPVVGSAAESVAGEDFILALSRAFSGAAPAVAGALAASVGPLAVAIAEEPLSDSLPESLSESLLDEAAAAAQFADMLVLPWVPPVPVVRVGTDALGLLGTAAGELRASLQSIDVGTSGAGALGGPAAALLEATAVPQHTLGLDHGPLTGLTERPGLPAPATEATAARTLHTSVGTSAWPEELGTRLTLMAERGQHTASLRLSPEHLGPLEIRIAIRDDQASVWFGAAHADTRAAIEHALPRLRELFAAQGMTLTDAGVSREPPREHLPPSRQPGSSSDPAADGPVVIGTRTLQHLGLIDAYA
jgi:hypothetical protein